MRSRLSLTRWSIWAIQHPLPAGIAPFRPYPKRTRTPSSENYQAPELRPRVQPNPLKNRLLPAPRTRSRSKKRNPMTKKRRTNRVINNNNSNSSRWNVVKRPKWRKLRKSTRIKMKRNGNWGCNSCRYVVLLSFYSNQFRRVYLSSFLVCRTSQRQEQRQREEGPGIEEFAV